MITRQPEIIRAIEDSRLIVLPGPTLSVIRRDLCRLLTLPNPHYRDAIRFGRCATGLVPELRYYADLPDGGVSLPRGAETILREVCQLHGLDVFLHDETVASQAVDYASKICLSTAQERAVRTVLSTRKGQLVAPTGGGKTLMGLELITRRRQPALWLVHTNELAQQARQRAVQFLGLDPTEIGMIGAGKRSVGPRLTIGMVQTLARGIPDELLKAIGHVVVDECHHVPAEMTARVVSRFSPRYLLGLSATAYRRDGLDPVIEFYLGPVAATMDKADLIDRLITPRVYRVDTGVRRHVHGSC